MSENKEELFSEELPEIPEEPGEDFDWEEAAKRSRKLAEEARGVAKRNYKDFSKVQSEFEEYKNKPEEPDKPEASTKKEGFDYGELAYLKSSDIDEGNNERLFQLTQETGMELKDLLKKDWVMKEIEENKAKSETQNATPKGNKPSGQHNETDIDYWLTREEYPDDPELARKVNKARREKAKKSNKFTKKPIA